MLLYSILKDDLSFISLQLFLSTVNSCHVLCPTRNFSETNITAYRLTKAAVYFAAEPRALAKPLII